MSRGAPLTSIAVLPFDDMSPGGDQKWLGDGMAEELIETLSRIEALRVPARTSAFVLRGKDIRRGRVRDWLAYADHRSGRNEEALQAAVRGLPAEGLQSVMSQGFQQAGFPGAVRARHEWLVARSGKPCTNHPAAAARDLALFGEADGMFECLREAIDRRDEVFLEADPVLNHGRLCLSSQCEQRSEVRVGGDENSALARSQGQHVLVARRLKSMIPNVAGIVTAAPQALRHQWRQSGVYEESHGARRGSSRSRTASAAYCSASWTSSD